MIAALWWCYIQEDRLWDSCGQHYVDSIVGAEGVDRCGLGWLHTIGMLHIRQTVQRELKTLFLLPSYMIGYLMVLDFSVTSIIPIDFLNQLGC